MTDELLAAVITECRLPSDEWSLTNAVETFHRVNDAGTMIVREASGIEVVVFVGPRDKAAKVMAAAHEALQ